MSSIGIDSLLNETKYSFRRGQRIRFADSKGEVKVGTYVMASSYPDHIVLNMGGRSGMPAVVPVGRILLSSRAKRLLRPEWNKMKEFLDKPPFDCYHYEYLPFVESDKFSPCGYCKMNERLAKLR